VQIDPVTVKGYASEAPVPAPAARAPVRSPAPAAPPPAPAAAAAQAARVALEAQQVREAAAEANRRLAEKGSDLTFEFDDVLGRMIFKLIDRQTNEVLRQIPSQELLEIARALAQDIDAGALMRTSA
jgi:flagellar protein FlaG